MRAAVYVRISSDPEGERAGVERQREDCLEECARRGWQAVVFEDNDIGASTRTRKDRPAYRAMLAAVLAGEVQAIVAYDGSRLHRRPAELEEFITAIEVARIPVVQVRGGSYDFGSADDRFKARVIGNAAALEAEKTGERVARQKRSAAERGEPVRGGRRPWGFQADFVTHDPVEAEEVRAAARDLLAGKSLTSVAARVGRLPSSVRNALVSPRMVGRRTHRGQTFPGAWDPILDLDTWEALRAALAARKRTFQGPGGRRARRYLLSGLAACSVCGARAYGGVTKGRAQYGCGLGHVKRDVTHLDRHVRDWVLRRAKLAVEVPGADPALAAAVTGYEIRLGEAREMWQEGDLSRSEYLGQKRDLEAKLSAARVALGDATEVEVWLPWPAADERGYDSMGPVMEDPDVAARYAENLAWWGKADLRQQQGLVAKYVQAVVISPQPRSRGFLPGFVEIVPVQSQDRRK